MSGNGPKRLSLGVATGEKLKEIFGDDSKPKVTEATLEGLKAGWKKGTTYVLQQAWLNFGDVRFKRTTDEGKIRDLTHSIQTKGQQAPILVKFGEDGRLIIVFGWHRALACQAAGVGVEGRITDLPDNECRELALIENLIRNELSPYDEAKAIHDLEEINRKPVNEIAELIQKDEKSVYAILRIFKFPVIVEALKAGEISSLSTARHLAAKVGPRNIPDEMQKQIILGLRDRLIRVNDLDFYLDKGGLPEMEAQQKAGTATTSNVETTSESMVEGAETVGHAPGSGGKPTPSKPATSRNYFQKFQDGKISFVTPRLSVRTETRELKRVQAEAKRFTESLDRLIAQTEKETKGKAGKK